jgi:rhodanese-related sulfurtransferase
VNFRDLGGVRLAGGGVIPAGLLYRSDAPYAGDAVPDAVAAWPPATVIDLRSSGESPAGYQWPAGVTVHHVPLIPEAAVVSKAGKAADGLPRSLDALYRLLVDRVPGRLASLFAIAANAEAPVLVHCAAGKDRTGIAVAALLLAGGAEPADIVADYTATAQNMPALLDRLRVLGQRLPADIDPASELLASPAAAISAVTEHLAGWPGGPRAWARAHGASAADLRRWQQRLAGAAEAGITAENPA